MPRRPVAVPPSPIRAHHEVDGVGSDVEHTGAHAARLLRRRDALVTQPDAGRNRTPPTCIDVRVVHMPTRLSTGNTNRAHERAVSGTIGRWPRTTISSAGCAS